MGFAASFETALRCDGLYRQLAALDDDALRRRGVARRDVARLSAVAAGLLSPGEATREFAEDRRIVQDLVGHERVNLSRKAA